MQFVRLTIFLALVVTGCSSAATPEVQPPTTLPPLGTTDAPPGSTSAPTIAPSTTTAAPTTSEAPTNCRRVTNFDSEAEQIGWRVTLDGVMGGLSSGEVSFDDSVMVFTGEIVTNGGGFSLLRTPMGGDDFAEASHLIVRAKTNGRGYEMVFKDDGDQRLFHEAKIPLTGSTEWQEVRIELAGLIATSNGRLVDAPPFNPDEVSEMGVILKDGVDGQFQIEIDWIDACR